MLSSTTGSEQVIALFAGHGQFDFRLCTALEAENIIGAPFVPPATDKNGCVVRLSINSNLQLNQCLDSCTEQMKFIC